MVPIAHRARRSWPSIEAAIAAGAHWVEIDVKLTRDGVPVVLHDRTSHRIWNIPRPVADLAVTDLPGEIPTLRSALDPAEVAFTGDTGMLVSTYTVDDPARMRWLARHGVDAIIPNDIVALAAMA